MSWSCCYLCKKMDSDGYCKLSGTKKDFSDSCSNFESIPCCASCRYWHEDFDDPTKGKCDKLNGYSPYDSICQSDYFLPKTSNSSGGTSYSGNPKTTLTGTAIVALIVLGIIISVVTNFGHGHKNNYDYDYDYDNDSEYTEEQVTEQSTTQSVTTQTQPTEDTAEILVGAYRTINADGGLNLRDDHDKNAGILCLMENGYNVYCYKIVNGWAYVDYKSYSGWCSTDFLVDSPLNRPVDYNYKKRELTYTFTEEQLSTAKREANAIIESFRGKQTERARTTMDETQVIDFFKEAASVTNSSVFYFPSIIGKVMEVLEQGEYALARIDKSKFNSLEDICDYFFSYYTDDIAVNMLTDRIFVIDGEFYGDNGAAGEEEVRVEYDFSVAESENRYDVTLKTTIYREDETEITEVTYPCVFENGRWVWAIRPYMHS